VIIEEYRILQEQAWLARNGMFKFHIHMMTGPKKRDQNLALIITTAELLDGNQLNLYGATLLIKL
jgi:hypothetical protein